MDSMLQKFLDAGMLDIVDDDTQYRYLSETSQELADGLVDNIRDVIPFTLVALDPGCVPTDPVFERIEKSLKTHWRLLRQRFADRPRQIYRAIAFESLVIAGSKHEKIFPLVWLTGKSYLPYAHLNNELEICRDFFRELGSLFDRAYGITNITKLPQLQICPATPTLDLEEQWAASISSAWPYKSTNLSTNNRNPNPQGSPSSFPRQEWINEFAPRAAQLLAGFYNDQSKDLSNNIEEFLYNFVQDIQKTVNLKSDMLWWRQTLYSSSQQQSYRDMEVVLASVIMAIDLHQQTPSVYPISTDYMLSEAVNTILSQHGRHSVTLENYLEMIDLEDNRNVLQSLFDAQKSNDGRNTLLALTQAYLYGRPIAKESIRQRLGITPDVEIPLPHLAVWLFRDLQAQKIIRAEEN